MKQIIVNISNLSPEEKESVNEALAKFTGAYKLPVVHPNAGWLLTPDAQGSLRVDWSWLAVGAPTHTPEEVLEMAGMTEKRKVRADFDKRKEYSVNVSNCTEDEKKKVQQAFFDVGISWGRGHNTYIFLDARQYTNTTSAGVFTTHLIYGSTTEDCNMTAKEFLDLVYEPEQVGHVHADLMAMYAEDAKTLSEPWKLWEYKGISTDWLSCKNHPQWNTPYEYRRKPRTHLVHGVEIPDFEFTPKVGESYYAANVGLPEFFEHGQRLSECCTFTQRMIERGLIYPRTEEGRQAAILHAKTMLGITH